MLTVFDKCFTSSYDIEKAIFQRTSAVSKDTPRRGHVEASSVALPLN